MAVLRQHLEDYPPRTQDIPHIDGSTVHGVSLVFTTKSGRAGTLQEVAFMVRIARAVAGLPDAVTFHTLRHTYASLQIAAGTNITALRDRMGHGSITVTGDTYGHLYPLEDDRTRDAIDNAFAAEDDEDGGTAGLPATA